MQIASRSTLQTLKQHIPALILGGAVLIFASPAQACSCASNTTPFVQRSKLADAVVRAKVVNYQHYQQWNEYKRVPYAMTLEIQEVLKGKVKPGKLLVWGGNGLSCNPYVTNFPIGTEWVFALSKEPYNHPKGLSVAACGESALVVKNGSVIGGITEAPSKVKPRTMRLQDFRTLLKSAQSRSDR